MFNEHDHQFLGDSKAMTNLEAMQPDKTATDLIGLKEQVLRLTSHDQDTGLLNLEAFTALLNAEIAKAEIRRSCAAFIEIRLRGLSRIGEIYGRKAIGSAIVQLARRLQEACGGYAVIGRIDHKSFGVLISDIQDVLMVLQRAKELVALCAKTIHWQKHSFAIDAVAGVTLTSNAGREASTLFQQTSMALRSASENGSPGYAFYNPEDAPIVQRRNELVAFVRDAIEVEAFELAYQPFFEFQSGALAGFEVLMRLKHPDMGAVSPAEFIPIAEETGLISKLGAWCVRKACQDAASWPQHLTVAVNFSPEQFYSGTLLSDIHNALEQTHFPAYRLEVEITEGTLLKSQDLVLSQLNALRDMGCSIALDDFGTGYSSLSYLWQFPLSKLKIDRSFIHALDTTPKAPGILRSIIAMSRNLGLKVTAEGIETMEQMATLRGLKCDYLQGFLCGRPTSHTNAAAIILKNFAEMLEVKSAGYQPQVNEKAMDLLSTG